MAEDKDKRSDIPDWEEEPDRTVLGGTTMEIFDSLDEFLRICDRREYNSWVEDEDETPARERRVDRSDTFANMSYEESRQEALYGSDVKTEDLAQKLIEADNLFGWDKQGRAKRKYDVQGGYPSVPRSIKNLPKSMVKKDMQVRKGKIITIVYDIGINCGISLEQQKRKGAQVVSVLKQLEAMGYRVRFDVVWGNTNNGISHVCRIKVKSEQNSLNLKRIAAICMNGCFSRRLCFDWYERLPNARYFWGYGQPFMNSERVREDFKKNFLGSHEYYISFSDDIKKVFKEQLSLEDMSRDGSER